MNGYLSKIETILVDTETGLMPWLERSLGGNWNRFQIRPWFPKGTTKDCGYRLREASSEIENDLLKINQIVMVGRVFWIEDHTEGVLKASQLQQDLDYSILHWSRFICDKLAGDVTSFEGGPLSPMQNKNISDEQPYAWECHVIRYFTIQYYGEPSIDFCDLTCL